ncbi:MAG: hypothetical protein A2Y67_00775 [Candidatus Buchananbacteria bacterium RBG_13_39_9]|uniref:dTDP-4-dehydrorhamnose reductase n=1 Tax=Candidatus Buchananbacteria bacterium RBG_13_39_9 TaxID=1797531 RepID=A0A1G1XLX1_9BACT|nr:MAG: hypothetical protein A2Y67_00775 [Candidatus Buchananbacteria bacterium RBG_13_39_9]
MTILITGASSYVGARIYVDLKKNFNVVGTYYSLKLFPELEFLDISNKIAAKNFILKTRPNIIIHAAANASNSWCEKHPEQAKAINEEGTKNIVEAANNVKAKVIFISTFAVANTGTLYGQTKIKSEEYVKEAKFGYVILRPSLIVGFSPNTTNDRPFNRIMKNITENVPAIYDISWRFQPTWLKHIVEVIEVIIQKNIINEIIPISVPEIKTRFDLAKDILSEFNIEVKPEDKEDSTPVARDDLEKLKELKLPFYTYSQMIEGIRQEIKSNLKHS